METISINRHTHAQNEASGLHFIHKQLDHLKRKLALLEQQSAPPSKLVIPNRKGIQLLRSDQIVRLEADGNYCRIHLNDGTSVLASTTLKALETKLPAEAFIRVHASHLIRKELISQVENSPNILTLENGEKVPFSRTRKKAILDQLTGSAHTPAKLQRLKISMILLLMAMFFTTSLEGQTITATSDENDAFISVSWSLPKLECDDFLTPMDVDIELLGNGLLLQVSSFGNSDNLPDTINGFYTHQIGPDANIDYTIRIVENVGATTLCSYMTSGTTLPFQEVSSVSASNALRPDSIFLTWTNNSNLADNFAIYRDGVFQSFVEGGDVGNTFSFKDAHDLNDSLSIQEGVNYNYCVQTLSDLHGTFGNACDQGSTFDIIFSATDDVPDDRISLAWNDISTFGDRIRVLRNGVQINVLPSSAIDYDDLSPVFGLSSAYDIILVKDNIDLVMVTDTGRVPANGDISGSVLTREGYYTIENVQVELKYDTIIDGAPMVMLAQSTLTDFNGKFQFTDIFYTLERDFYIEVTKNGKLFEEPQLITTLNSAFPVQTDIIFFESSGYDPSGIPHNMTSFTATADAPGDRVLLNWTYTRNPSKVSYFNIFRGSDRIIRLNDAAGEINSFVDLEGIPGQTYLYTISSFHVSEVNDEVTEKSLTDQLSFPVVAPVLNLTGAPNPVSGVIDLDWGPNHTSNNFTGFRLFRDGQQIAEIESDVFDYEDLEAPPGINVDYTIVSYHTVQEVDYESVDMPSPALTLAMPVLPQPDNFSLNAMPMEDLVALSWTVPAALTNTYNYEGFFIYRKEMGMSEFEIIGKQYKNFTPPGQTAEFKDKTGKPNVSYTYKVATVLKTSSDLFTRFSPEIVVAYPEVLAPTGLLGTGSIGKVALTWNMHSSLNHDGFQICRDSDSIGISSVGHFSFDDLVNNPPIVSANYEVKSYRIVDGVKYFSNTASVVTGPDAPSNGDELPQDFYASDDVANHIKLCWKYNKSKVADFVLARDGVNIDTIPSSQGIPLDLLESFTYYDYGAPDNYEVEYTLFAIHLGSSSDVVRAVGNRRSFRTIRGRVSKDLSGQGVPGVVVTAKDDAGGSIYFDQVKTDSSGYFEFLNAPLLLANMTVVEVDGDNSDFDSGPNVVKTSSTQFQMTSNQDVYEIYFTDYFEMPGGSEQALPKTLTAVADPAAMQVVLSWSTSNANYSGYEVFRATSLLGIVEIGEELIFEDKGGFPGIVYDYVVRSYWNTPEGKIYSDLIGANIEFPILESVTHLNATPIAQENVWQIAWSHPYDMHDFYRVERNGEVLGTIASGNAMEELVWIDSTGIPSKLYEYRVTAIKDQHTSETKSVSFNYGKVAEVRNLTSTIPTIPGCDGSMTSQNHVLLEWEYTPAAADGFEVYRNGVLAHIVPAGLLSERVLSDSLVEIVNTLDMQMKFSDFTGQPGISTEYTLIPFVTRDGDNFNSGVDAIIPTTTEVFPEFGLIRNLSITPRVTNADLLISFEYDTSAVDGFRIYRAVDLNPDIFVDDFDTILFATIFSVNSPGPQIEIVDGEGIPGELIEVDEGVFELDTNGIVYDYLIKPFAVRNNLEFTGDAPCKDGSPFPALPRPSQLNITNLTTALEFDWSYDNDIPITGFEIVILPGSATQSFPWDVTLIDTIIAEPGARTALYAPPSLEQESFIFRIRSFRTVDGVNYYSQIIDTGYPLFGQGTFGDDINPEYFNGENQFNFRMGFSVAAENQFVAGGAPSISSFGKVKVYNYDDDDLSLDYTDTSGDEFGRQGQVVAISGDYMTYSAPRCCGDDGLGNGTVIVESWNGSSWTIEDFIATGEYTNAPDNEDQSRFGVAVDIWDNGTDQWVAIGAKNMVGTCSDSQDPNPNGRAFVAKNNGAEFEADLTSLTHPSCTGNISTGFTDFGAGIAIYDNHLLVTSYNENTNLTQVFHYLRSGSTWNYIETLGSFDMHRATEVNRLDMYEDMAIIGADDENKAYIYKLDGGTYDLEETLTGTGDFGYATSIHGKYVLVGAPLDDEEDTDAGAAYLYRTNSLTNINYVLVDEKILAPNADDGDQFGRAVDLSDIGYVIGAPFKNQTIGGFDQNVGALYNFHLGKIIDAEASDDEIGKVDISWDYEGPEDGIINGFKIYRNDEANEIGTVTGFTMMGGEQVFDRTFTDSDVDPGVKYIYSIAAFTSNSNHETPKVTAIGMAKANGVIKGTVTVANTSVPVPGVEIAATGMVDGSTYIYKDTTNSVGKYTFPFVQYSPVAGSDTEYLVEASLNNHDIIPAQGILAVLSNPAGLGADEVSGIDFTDATAFVVSGKVSRRDVDCKLGGIRMVLSTNTSPDKETFTDPGGNYGFTINPYEAGLTTLSINAEDTLLVDGDTLLHAFLANAQNVFTDFASFPSTTFINFEDTLTYPVNLTVRNTCGSAISADSWSIRIRSFNGCYDQTHQTNSSGNLLVDLPLYNYTMKVVAVNNISPENQLALDFFAGVPVKLNLLDIQIDTALQLTPEQLDSLTQRSFVYHKAPSISVNGFNNYFCNDLANTAIIVQDREYILQFDIFETFDLGGNPTDCDVKEGKLKITNPASQEPEVVILYNEQIQGFPNYTFIAGDPNQVSPYVHGMVIDYLSDDDEFLGNIVVPVFVEGTVAVPGTDIIVDPTSNDQVQYPLFVLRDPPGDKSSSFIETGQTLNEQVSFGFSESSSIKIFGSGLAAVAGVGASFSTSITTGQAVNGNFSWNYSLTTKKKIQTSNSPSQIGRSADVMVGLGVATQYGLINTYTAADCDTILKEVSLGIAPTGVNTTWSYTIGQIEGIIASYRLDSIKVENGSLQIVQDGAPLSKDAAIEKLSALINNWAQVVHYHDVETLPHYLMCASEPPGNLAPTTKAEVNNWQNDFCGQIGTYDGDDFTLFNDIQWDADLIESYNRGAYAIRNLALTGDTDTWGWSNGDFAAIASAHGDFANTFGPLAQNYTTGGVIQNSQSIKNVSASKKSVSEKIFVNTYADLSIFASNTNTVVLGAPGAGKIKTLSKLQKKAGIAGTLKLSINNSYQITEQNSTTVGFTILDDDAIDQHSIFVIQGPAQNHTPYFESFGSRTSCPPEDGSIFVDDPSILIFENGGTFSDRSLYNVPENDAALFTIQLGNNTPINSEPSRDLEVFLVNGKNPNGATVKMDGDQIGSKVYSDVAAGVPIFLQLSVERGLLSYDYADIQIGVRPACGGDPEEFITVSVYFTSPCSPVTLVAPDNNWVVNQSDSLLLCIRDYQPTNSVLEEVVVEYRRVGAGTEWIPVPLPELGLMAPVDTNVLIAWNAMIAEGQVPAYYFLWTIPQDNSFYPDGDYELRVVMDCGFSNTVSNVVPGKIDRSGLRLFGTPQPSDGIWTSGDEISVSFNKNLDCPLMEDQDFIDENISLIDQTTGLAVDFTMVCYDNKLIFETVNPMSTYDSHILEVSVDEIQATTGAKLVEPESWGFRVITQKLFWETADTVQVLLYEGESTTRPVQIFNSTGIETLTGLNLIASDGKLDPWLSFNPGGTFSISPAGGSVDFSFSANQALGSYTEEIEITGIGSGVNPKIVFEMTVLSRRPDWDVDISNFDESMILVSNWRFISQGQGEMSLDTADLISVWIDNEIRGLANVSAAGGQFFAAYITVFGNVEDNGKTLEFRVWDADEAIEYDAVPEFDDILFQVNDIKGSTGLPEILVVNPNKDRARYIPLNQGWTWFSINTNEVDMSIQKQLRSLIDVSDGDVIKTEGKFAQYIDGHGWYSQGDEALNALNKDEGYLIYIDQAKDTIRVTGFNAVVDSIDLDPGWNWIGYPLQEAQSINDVLDLDPENGDNVIKTVRQDGTSPFADYDVIFGEWNGSLNELRPNDAYKFFNGNVIGAQLNFNEPSNFNGGGAPIATGGSQVLADTADVNTWTNANFNYEYVMHLVGSVQLGSDTVNDVNDRIALFVGNDLRGTGFVQYIAPTDQYEVSLLAGSITANEMFTIYHFDASENTITRVPVEITYNEDGYGSFTNPYIIDFGDCPELLTINPGVTPISGVYQARTEINVTGKLTIEPGGILELSAPIINWTADQLTTLLPGQQLIINTGCN